MMKHLLFAAVLCAGCEGLTSTPAPTISVLKHLDSGCYALMTPDSPIAPELGVTGTCNEGVSPWFFAGVDLVEVVVDYGPDVDFDDSTQAPAPAISLALDGTPVDLPIDLTSGRAGDRAFFVATFRAPAQPSRDVRIGARVNQGFGADVPIVFRNLEPPAAIELAECPTGISCELPGAVGSAHFQLIVDGDLPQTVTLHATLDGAQLADPVPPVTTRVFDTYTSATVAIPVPAAHDGAVWAVSAQVGGSTPSSVSATIHAPQIATALSCGDTCALAPGDAVGLEITAPAAITPLQALVDTRIDGVPELIAAPVELVANADGTATGLLALHAPASAGTWEINASVAGYRAAALVTAVQ
jgi:hypothetical protein